MSARWQKGGNTRVEVMARISTLDLRQRFSIEDGNSVRILRRNEDKKKNKIKSKEKEIFKTKDLKSKRKIFLRIIGNKNGNIRHSEIISTFNLFQKNRLKRVI